MQADFRDCYARFDGHRLVIGNSCVERTLLVARGGLASESALEKKTGAKWEREAGVQWIGVPFAAQQVCAQAGVYDNGGLSEQFLQADLIWTDDAGARLTKSFIVFPELPFVSMSMRIEGVGEVADAGEALLLAQGVEDEPGVRPRAAQKDAIDTLPMPAGHYKLRSVVLADKSDQNDALVRESEYSAYTSGGAGEWHEGSIFILNDYVRDRAVMLVKDAPANMSEQNRQQKDLLIRQGAVASLVGTGLMGTDAREELYGHGCTMGFGKRNELPGLFHRFYRAVWARRGAAKIMSNTWGDRSRDAAVCQAFMQREIACAADIGVDIVQIDDGWQKGHTTNSALKKGGVWEGYYAADPDFWTVDAQKFPLGLEPLVEQARSGGMEMGLWFSPDSTNDFANWRRDADTLLRLWREKGVCHFKLDGVNIRSKRGERNYLRLLEAVTQESGGKIGLNQDITAQVRLGSQYFRQYGNLFVENRYTDSTAYYPHRTLKNLWTMCEFIPPAKLQFELLNPRRNDALYPADDPFRPNMYTEDYLFATVMLSSPLVWMEMCHLAPEDTRALKKIVAVYREHRQALAQCDVAPIGDCPDGMSMPGFLVSGEKGGYLLLFREDCARDMFQCHLPAGARVQLLASNADARADIAPDGAVDVYLPARRAYAFIRWEI